MWHQLDLIFDRKIQEAEREFYGLIGLVAVRFARLEAALTALLGALIHPDDELMAATLTEDMQLARTVELIKKIGRIRISDTSKLFQLTSSVDSLRRDRNDFIHGTWSIIAKDDGSVEATCSHIKTLFEEKGDTKQWTRSLVSKKVTLNRLRKIALELEEISRAAEEIAENLEDNST